MSSLTIPLTLAVSFCLSFGPTPGLSLGVIFSELQFTDNEFTVDEGQAPSLMINYVADSPIFVEECTGSQILFISGDATAADLVATDDIEICVPPGGATGTFSLDYHQTFDDADLEADEGFSLFILQATGITSVVFGFATVTIIDNDGDPRVQLEQSSYTFDEGDGDVSVCAEVFNVIGAGTTFPIDVTFSFTASGLAVENSDYTLPASLMTTFPIGSVIGSTACVTISVTDDDALEGEETLDFELTAAVDGSGGMGVVNFGSITMGSITIADDEMVTVTFAGAMPPTLAEDGTTTAPDIVVLMSTPSGGLERDITLSLTTDDSIDPLTTLDVDYSVPSPFEVTFSASDTMATATGCQAIQDTSIEGDHSFDVLLDAGSVPAGYTNNIMIGSGTIRVTILDDDVDGVEINLASISDALVEGAMDMFCATINLNGNTLDTELTVDLSITEEAGIAVEDEDFTIDETFLSFTAGTLDGGMACVDFTIIDDDDLEFDHSFSIGLSFPSSPAGASLGMTSPPMTDYTITDDEADTANAVSITQALMTVPEDDGFPVSACVDLDASIMNVERMVNVTLMATGSGEAVLGADFDFMSSNMVEFPVGPSSQQCVDIVVTDDNIYEGSHSFMVSITSVSPPLAFTGQADFAIIDPEDATFSFSQTGPGYTFAEDVSGGTFDILVELDETDTLVVPVNVPLVVTDDTAASGLEATGGDFNIASAVAMFNAGQIQAMVTFTVFDDVRVEGDESFDMSFMSSTLYTTGSGTTVTITDTGLALLAASFMASTMSVMEDVPMADVVVTLASASTTILEVPVTIGLTMSDADAIVDQDFSVSTPTEVTFQACDPCSFPLQRTFSGITIINDANLEGDHSFAVSFNTTVPTVMPTSLMITITDDEVGSVVQFTSSMGSMLRGKRTVASTIITVDETDNAMTPAEVCVEIVGVFEIQIPDFTVTVMFSRTLPAVVGEDTTLASMEMVTFVTGSDGPSCLPFNTIDNDDWEGEELVFGDINSATSSVMLTLSIEQVEIQILDPNDASFALVNSMISPESDILLVVDVSFFTDGMRVNGNFGLQLALTPGTADFGSTGDFASGEVSAGMFTVNIAEGAGSGVFSSTFSVFEDDILEEDETFTVAIMSSAEYNSSDVPVTYTIQDSDAADFEIELSLASIGPASEMTMDMAMVNVTLSRMDGAAVVLDRTVTVTLDTTDTDIAVMSGVDFTHASPLEVEFTACDPCMPMDLQSQVIVSVLDDPDLEFDHTFEVIATGVDPSGIMMPTPLPVAIQDDETNLVMIEFDSNSFTCAEGTTCEVTGSLNGLTGAIQASFTINLDYDFAVDGLTDAGDIMQNPSISFVPGDSPDFTVIIPVTDDNDFEGLHSFTVSINGGGQVSVGAMSLATITITDFDDATIGLVEATQAGSEGDLIDVCAEVINLSSGAFLAPISLMFNVVPSDASTADYTVTTSTTVMFGTLPAPVVGETQCVTISLETDDILEPTQSFAVILSSTNAEVTTLTPTSVDILNTNTALFEFQFESLDVKEGINSTADFSLVVISSPAGGLEGEIEIPLNIVPSGTTVGMDFSMITSTVMFGVENTITPMSSFVGSVSTPASVSIIDDDILEDSDSEDIGVVLAPIAGLSSGADSLTINICDDEEASVSISPQSYTAVEGDISVMVCVVISDVPSGGTEVDVVVTLISIDGDKTVVNEDFTVPDPFEVTFPSGATMNGDSQCAAIGIVDDMVFEGDQQNFGVNISSVNLPNVQCIDCSGSVTIVDDEMDFPTVTLDLSASPFFAQEGSLMDVCFNITDLPMGDAACPITITLIAAPGGDRRATDVLDFTSDLTAEIPVGSTSGCIVFTIIDDEVVEGSETFNARISSTTPEVNFNPALAFSVIIEDNDVVQASFASPSSTSVIEANGAYSDVCIMLVEVPSGGIEREIELVFSTEERDAVMGEDFDAFEIRITIPTNATTGDEICADNVRLDILDDDIVEGDQSFVLVLEELSPLETVDFIAPSEFDIVIMDDSDSVKLGFEEREYSFPELTGNQNTICVVSDGQIQRSIFFSVTSERLIAILRGEPREVEHFGDFTLGPSAGPSNTLTDELVCANVTNDEDGQKEGTTLTIIRLETNDSAVCPGRDQALLIEEANGVVTASVTTLAPHVNESAGSVEICVSLSQLPLQDIASVQLSTISGSAEEMEDFVPFFATLEWHYDSPSLIQCVDIPIINDECVEEKEEYFIVSLSTDEDCVELNVNYTMVTIYDDDSLLLDFRMSQLQVEESAGVATSCVYICNGEPKRNATFQLHAFNGTAYSPDDFVVGGPYYELTFTPYNADQDLCVNISIIDDSVYESTEYFGNSLSSNDPCVEFKQDTAQIGILDDDCIYLNLTQESYMVEEADGFVEVCVELVGELEGYVDAMIFAISGDATDVVDYAPWSDAQNVQFHQPGEQCSNISIEMDQILENTEFFSVVLGSRDDRVKIHQRVARIYILDSGTVTVGFTQMTYTVPEEDGNGDGFVQMVCVELFSGDIDRDVVISVSAADGSAIGELDYQEFEDIITTIDLTFQPVIGKRRKRNGFGPLECTSVTILSDNIVENTEYFQLMLSTDDDDVMLMPANATVMIIDNDYANVSLEQDEYSVAEEGGNVTVCAVLTGGDLGRDVSVEISSVDGSATGDDYLGIQDFPLVFQSGSAIGSSACVTYQITDDSIVEDDEQFFASLSTTDPVHIGPIESATVTITDTDVLEVGLTQLSYTVNEADGYRVIGVEVLSGSLQIETSVSVFTSSQLGDTASPGDDYEALSDDIVIPSGSVTGDIVYFNVSIIDDTVVEELMETFSVGLNGSSRVVVSGTSSATVVIMEDLTDTVTIGFQSAAVNVSEGDNGTVCVEISGDLARDLMVNISLAGGSASDSGVDYSFPASTGVTFSTSPDTYCLNFPTTQDDIYEDNESFSVHLDTVDSQVTYAFVYSSVSILDDDKVGFSLSADESVCEGAGTIQVCVQLETEIELSVVASVETMDMIAQAPDDFIQDTLVFYFIAPATAFTMICLPVTIVDDSDLEPCENFGLSISSSSDRSCIIGSDSSIVQINDDEDITDDLLLFNDSPDISGRNLSTYFTLNGCAQVLCEVRSRTDQVDCTPPVGSFEGHWFAPSVTGRRTLQNMAITVMPYCTGQAVPIFEDRPFRIDGVQCSQHFTDQQYTFDSASGDVTVEWEGTGPDEFVQVSQFTCSFDGGAATSCTSPHVLSGLAQPGNYTLTVAPVGIAGCTRQVARSLLISI